MHVSIHSRLFKPGEYDGWITELAVTGVSIHSRLFKPGELLPATKTTLDRIRFQSTPDYLNRENVTINGNVTGGSVFQSTPDYLNRENGNLDFVKARTVVFQSTPDYLNRENAATGFRVLRWDGFQSTPDYLNRENRRVTSKTVRFIHVSIHSRLFKPGEWLLMRPPFTTNLFQSTPDYLNRENWTTSIKQCWPKSFNPLPII